MGAQLGLDLTPKKKFSLDYLVPHSGIVSAVGMLEQVHDELVSDSTVFRSIFLSGPSGVGKSHVAEAYAERLRRALDSYSCCTIFDVEPEQVTDAWIRGFISEYERHKREGGLLVLLSRHSPDQLTTNDHVVSRISTIRRVDLAYPNEQELRPLLSSLSERRNLRLSVRNMDYLIRRLPLNPLSFDTIFANIDQLCISQGKSARLGVIREVVLRQFPFSNPDKS